MSGFRTEEYYITKFGKDDGKKQYAKVLEARKQRDIRKKSNISIKLSDDLETEIVAGNAVKCQECGYIGTRLQWTHFKHNCTGRFSNGKEYMIAFPDASVVAPNLAKSTVVTLEKMIMKYGIDEGNRRWQDYCSIQADVNTFEYKKEKFGWDEEKYKKYNRSRAVTLQNLIERHGVEEGQRIWDEYCERQRYTTSLEYFIQTFGEEVGKARYDAWDRIRCRNGNGCISQAETEFFDELQPHIRHSNPIRQYYFGGKLYDFVDEKQKIFIEFNGDYWHLNPKIYVAEYVHPKLQKTALEIWKDDIEKQNLLINEGYSFLIVWEQDWRKDREGTCMRVARWWNERVEKSKNLQDRTT